MINKITVLIKNINKKKVVIFLLIIIVLIFFGVFIWSRFINYRIVNFVPAQETSIAFGTSKSDVPSVDNIIIKTSSKTSMRIKRGYYFIEYSGDGYQSKTNAIEIKKSTDIKTPILDFTDEKLKKLLEQEKAKIQKVIYEGVNNQQYTIINEDLYKQGNWYGAVLVPKTPGLDILKIIAKQDDNKWIIAVKPIIVISIDDNPNIPQEIIRDINKKGF